ncbi:nucleotide-diphospho-sugar transferase [Xylaria palmicola]|nr:nucleotide-diphospho-sugar transferase [Xylaria palmicola]
MTRKQLIIGAGVAASLVLFLSYSYSAHQTPFSHDAAVALPPAAAAAAPAVEGRPLSEQPFPKKIWQSWKDDAEDPTPRTVGFPHRWRTVNHEHRYERITDANADAYVEDRFPASNASRVFAGLADPILRADLLRYLVLLLEGGVWADIDVLPHQPVSSWVPEAYRGAANLVVGIENDKHKRPIWPGSPYSVQLAQYCVLAKPGHPAVATLVDRVARNLERLFEGRNPTDKVTFAEVMSTTGPFAFTEVLMDYFTAVTGIRHTGDELDGIREPQLIGDVLVLPKDSFGWLPQEHDHEAGDPIILVEHLFIGSWRAGHPG